MQISKTIRSLILAVGVGVAAPAVHADQFLNFGQMGAPNSFAFESYPTVTRSDGKTSLWTTNILAYFTKTGLTGTNRDQFEFWGGGAAGYSKAAEGGQGHSWGFSAPTVGAEYYYNIVQPSSTCLTCEGYSIWTISPYVTVTFPTGSKDNTGFSAFSNNFTYYATLTNYVRVGNWTVSFAPVSVAYSTAARNATEVQPGVFENLRGGVSWTLADITAGYNINSNWAVGLHHVLRLNNQSASSFEPSRQAFIGPAVSYMGFAKHGLFLFGNVNFNYAHSGNIKTAPYASFVLVKYL
ncbi:hypothetical protein [Burkholderia thailandensis]|uniref:hypothetical protein n=1 Tax=Burkholderia thailandensis TaxID=57975 RepID=UPI002D771435|nr:hypothetical protein [Burkholderia thailandensis]WRS69943.1 hypothetical protein U9S59_29450 [Burkholderia thailandensis]